MYCTGGPLYLSLTPGVLKVAFSSLLGKENHEEGKGKERSSTGRGRFMKAEWLEIR